MNDHSPKLLITGHLDTVTPEGLVSGWCWDQASPDNRPEIVVLVDGAPVGSTYATNFRPDLLAAGIGDGRYGFSFVIPWTELLRKRTVTVAVVEASTRRALGKPHVLRNEVSASIEDRLAELEGKIRLLESRLSEIGQRSQAEPDTDTLFQTIGTFFTQLARDGVPPDSGLQLGTAIEVIEATHPALTVPACETPLVTICIDGGAPLTALHACVAALLQAKAGGRADLILLDPGRVDDAALLPVVVHNIRYIRGRLGPVQERNAIARLARTPFVIFLSGLATVSPGWLDEILENFAHHNRAGAVGGCILRDDGLLDRGGLVLGPDRHLIDLAAGRLADDVAQRVAQPVHTLPGDAVAFRHAALLECNGMDESYDTLAAAVTDLCFRLREREWSVLYQPYATVTWPQPGPDGPPPVDDAVRTRWLSRTRALPPLTEGRALLIGMPGEGIAAPLRAAERLQAMRYAVTMAAPTDAADRRTLARSGVASLAWSDLGALGALLTSGQFDLAWVASPQVADVLYEGGLLPSPTTPVLAGEDALQRFWDEHHTANVTR